MANCRRVCSRIHAVTMKRKVAGKALAALALLALAGYVVQLILLRPYVINSEVERRWESVSTQHRPPMFQQVGRGDDLFDNGHNFFGFFPRIEADEDGMTKTSCPRKCIRKGEFVLDAVHWGGTRI